MAGPNDSMHLSPQGAHFLKLCEEEGGVCKLRAYDDGTGTPTICWGCTQGVKMGDTKTEEQCNGLFAAETIPCEEAIHRLITKPISQPLFDILVSFFYNNGWGRCPALISAVNHHDDETIRKVWMMYTKARNERTGQLETWPGLVKRRSAELQYWATYASQANPVQPPAVAPPVEAPIETAKNSKSIGVAVTGGMIASFTQGVPDAFDKVFAWFGFLPKAVDEVRPLYDSGRETTEWFHGNWSRISVTFVAVAFAVIIVRHFLDKRKIAHG